jgi:catechol 2,3-dioxygenase-like lactoylglutathione lyase family enzyme
MPKITAAAPVLLVKDVTVSAEWYRDKLGFTIVEYYGTPPNFVITQRDGHYLMFRKSENEFKPNWKIVEKTSDVYFWVDDVETLYKEFIKSGAKIDYELYTAPYGVREFGVNDPDEYDISFGEIIKTQLK